ncbi:hypothetical protein D3C76_1555120 [compost metagenome]
MRHVTRKVKQRSVKLMGLLKKFGRPKIVVKLKSKVKLKPKHILLLMDLVFVLVKGKRSKLVTS